MYTITITNAQLIVALFWNMFLGGLVVAFWPSRKKGAAIELIAMGIACVGIGGLIMRWLS